MFGSNDNNSPDTFFTKNGVTNVFNTGGNMFTAMGPGRTDTYVKNGNMITNMTTGKTSTIINNGSTTTIFGSDGQTHTIFPNGTVL